MFSAHLPNHFPSYDDAPREYLYFGVGLVLVVSLLVSIAAVASGEVKKAKARDSLLASRNSAIAYCVENLRGTALNACMQQARADRYNDGSGSAVTGNGSGNALVAGGPAMVPVGATGLMPVTFNAVR
ncbi:hypothetical protein [Polaromonas sp.]|uniref:hypothetical protein n=1 Tax=Polaromonas sp. TaxID=1869339 RepID=UPI0032656FB3